MKGQQGNLLYNPNSIFLNVQWLEIDDVSPFQGLCTQNLQNVLCSCIKCVHSINELGTSKFFYELLLAWTFVDWKQNTVHSIVLVAVLEVNHQSLAFHPVVFWRLF